MNKFFNRPIAPHLTIYSLQGSSLLSIWHRISGVLLISFSAFFLVIQKFFLWVFYSPLLYNIIYLLQQLINSYTIFIIYILVLYHAINGLRHIFWDLGFLLSNKNITRANVSIILILFTSQILFYKNLFL